MNVVNEKVLENGIWRDFNKCESAKIEIKHEYDCEVTKVGRREMADQCFLRLINFDVTVFVERFR